MTAAAEPSSHRLPRRLLGAGDLDPILLCTVAVVLILVVVALAAPWIAPDNPDTVNILGTYQGSSSAHLLGTDSLGRDLFSRLIYGTRMSLLGPALVVTVSTIGGTCVGIASAWVGGWMDTVIARASDITFAFPGLILIMVVAAMFGPGLIAPVVALSIAYLPYLARLVRGAAMRERAMPYIAAGYVQGIRTRALLFRHLLPNLAPLILVQATLSFGSAIADLAAASYLGFGVQAPTPEWGLMVSTGQQSILAGHPAESLYAATMVVITVVTFTVLGERLAERFGTQL